MHVIDTFRRVYDREPEPDTFLDMARLAMIQRFEIGDWAPADFVDFVARRFVKGYDAVCWDAVTAGYAVLVGFDAGGHPLFRSRDDE